MDHKKIPIEGRRERVGSGRDEIILSGVLIIHNEPRMNVRSGTVRNAPPSF